uniref:Uncharacterized protein n=1 Tax=Lepeophtheirus salmonis TaxID=72036 RepID=A0A0K2VCJ3_LEPSM
MKNKKIFRVNRASKNVRISLDILLSWGPFALLLMTHFRPKRSSYSLQRLDDHLVDVLDVEQLPPLRGGGDEYERDRQGCIRLREEQNRDIHEGKTALETEWVDSHTFHRHSEGRSSYNCLVGDRY